MPNQTPEELGKPAIVSRQEAIESGSLYYYTGRSCTNGHLTYRYAKNYHCLKCGKGARRTARKVNATVDEARIGKAIAKEQRQKATKRKATKRSTLQIDAWWVLDTISLADTEGLLPPPDSDGSLAEDLPPITDDCVYFVEVSKDEGYYEAGQSLALPEGAVLEREPKAGTRFYLAITGKFYSVRDGKAQLLEIPRQLWDQPKAKADPQPLDLKPLRTPRQRRDPYPSRARLCSMFPKARTA